MTLAPLMFGFQISITPLLIFSLFGLLIGAWLIYSIILRYHWKNYSTNSMDILKMNLIYFVGSGIFIFTIGLFALLYSLPT